MVSNRGMKDDSRFGVDSRWSWITAFFCAWVLFLTMATVRMSGIFFYGIVEAFGVTRAEASWPVSLAGTLMVLGGPIAGYLCHRFSCRAVLLTCSPLAGIGASICFLARRLEFITISFGIIHGYFRDTYGDYTGLLHCLAVVNIFFVCIWTVKLIAKRRAKTTVTSKTGQDVFSVKSTKQKNGNVVG
ncbi:monocarboxylate transporter 13 isoform X2 [Rhipicephalus microplus]|uniref:monocarboxylate transporter 13 isoform X2 n=1 Tax=Rhipicephalus microplus TaxID=6941 RepID=UPI003F6C07EB